MSTTTPIDTSITITRVKALMERHNWSYSHCAEYLGVPAGTLGNWMQGTREPNAVVLRLLDVLGTIETFAPAIHATLMPVKVPRG